MKKLATIFHQNQRLTQKTPCQILDQNPEPAPDSTSPSEDLKRNSIIDQKNPNDIHITLQNVGDLAFPDEFKLQELLISAQNYQTDLLCITEHGLNMNRLSTCEWLRTNLRTLWPHTKAKLSSLKDCIKGEFMPGGHGIIVGPKLNPHVTEIQTEEYGRWATATIVGENKPILIISTYIPCQHSIEKTGLFTYATQLWRTMSKRGNTTTNPRETLWKDLTTYISNAQPTYNIILTFDANSNTNKKTSDVQRLCTKCNLIDTMAECNPRGAASGTFQRGNKRIDIILASIELIPYITKINPCNNMIMSCADHKGIMLDLEYKSVFANTLSSPRHPASRTLLHKRRQTVNKYIEYLESYMKSHKIMEKLIECNKKLKTNAQAKEHILDYLGIKNNLTRGMKAAEKRCGPCIYGYPWSPTLQASGKRITILKTIQRNFTYNPICLPRLFDELATVGIQAKQITSHNAIKILIKKAKNNHKQTKRNAGNLCKQYLIDQAEYYAIQRKQSLENILKQIHLTEATQRIYNKL